MVHVRTNGRLTPPFSHCRRRTIAEAAAKGKYVISHGLKALAAAALGCGINLCLGGGAQAQFGLKCDAPEFAYALNESSFSSDIKDAIRATCAFNKKSAEIGVTFGKPGWSWDLLPKARADIEELRHLADAAADLNFKTGDPRALGNIKHMYLRVGDQQRWLRGEESKYERLKQKAQSTQPGPADGTQTSADATFLFVVFQDNVSSADKDAFLQAYSASIIDGPDANQVYRLRLAASLEPDQLQTVLTSMNTQTRVVKSAFAR